MYLKKTTYMDEYQLSLGTVESQIRFIRPLIGIRYPLDAIVRTGKLIRIRDDVFRDAMCFRNVIEIGTAPEFKNNEEHVWNIEEA